MTGLPFTSTARWFCRLGRISPTTITGCAASPYDTDWQQFTYDLSAYQGQTIEIRLVNHTSDQWYNTWTYVDDVSVN